MPIGVKQKKLSYPSTSHPPPFTFHPPPVLPLGFDRAGMVSYINLTVLDAGEPAGFLRFPRCSEPPVPCFPPTQEAKGERLATAGLKLSFQGFAS